MATKTQPKSNSLLMLEEQFAYDVGKKTGIDPRVIFVQEQAEGAYAPHGTGGLNFLNLKSGTVSSLGLPYAGSTSAGFAQFSSLGQAESASVAEFKSAAIHVVPGITAQQDINAISASGWDEGHYLDAQGNNKLTTIFAEHYGKKALNETKVQPQPNELGFGGIIKAIVTAPAQVFQGATGHNVKASPTGPDSVAGQATKLGGATVKALTGFKFLQIVTMLAGGVLILLGLIIIVIGGRGTPAAQTTRALRTVAA